MPDLLADLGFALRRWTKRPTFAVTAVPWLTPDGKPFLVSMPPPGELPTPIRVDLNWEASLKK